MSSRRNDLEVWLHEACIGDDKSDREVDYFVFRSNWIFLISFLLVARY